MQMIEHFLYGTPALLKALRAALPDGLTSRDISGGLVMREELDADDALDDAIAKIEALAAAHGVEYDGHGEWLGDEPDSGANGLDILPQRFTKRTGIKPGHGFAFDLPNGRFGHAVYVGSDRMGYVLLDISTLVTDRPASTDLLHAAPKRYRQPILVWHTPFAVRPLAQSVALVELPRDVAFRCSTWDPEPDMPAKLEHRFGVTNSSTPEGWNTVLMAMAELGERLPGVESYTLWTARVSRTGVLKLTQDHTLHPYAPGGRWPMPWQPVTIDEVMAIMMGGADMITVRDRVI
jgi:hypothetical protein